MSSKQGFFLISILIISAASKYNQQESYRFKALDTTNGYGYQSFLSPDGDQLMVVDLDDEISTQTFYHFNGSIICQNKWSDINVSPIGWPLLTGGFYAKFYTYQIFKSDTLCSNYKLFDQFTTETDVFDWQFRNTSNQSFGTFISNRNQTINQYDLVKGTVQKSIVFQNNQFPELMTYSTNGEYLFLALPEGLKYKKVAVVQTESYQRLRTITSNMDNIIFWRGLNDGKSWLGKQYANYLYKVYQNGTSEFIYNRQQDYTIQVCTDEQVLVSLGYYDTDKSRLSVINVTDGAIIQNFTMNFRFINTNSQIVCNNKYLSIIDEQGFAHVFSVYEQPTPKPDDDDSESAFPTWAIIAISVGSLIIVGAIVAYIVFKRKQQIGGYKQFTNQKIKPSYKD